jgi:FMN-dependent oxidoreductase (nitrilotriacetate monooxygenase family)
MTQMNLGILVYPFGEHPSSWLHPDAVMGAEVDFRHFTNLAQTCERGLFDFFFIADAPGIRMGNNHAFKRYPAYMAQFEPITVLSALAAVTEHLGLAATVSSSYFEPYNLARQFASLDHISGGRAAWNIVTSTIPSLAANFGRDKPDDHAVRYRRAREFLDVTIGLWDSWDDDAFVRDVANVTYFDPNKMHALNHKGEFFSVAGPLNVPRSPQGRPVVIQAGGSGPGRDMAAATAEVVFTQERTFEGSKALRDDLHRRMAAIRRDPSELKLVTSIFTIIGDTEAEAKEKFGWLQSRIHPDVGREMLSIDLGNIDLSNVPLDEPIPADLLPEDTNRGKTYLASVKDLARKGLTLRQIYELYAPARGGLVFVGTADQAADLMGDWFNGGATDGFMLEPAAVPADLTEFVDKVVPVLQKRGLFRNAYEGRTLRENLGLKRPRSRYA